MAAQREWFEKDYYKTLGVSDTATAMRIKRMMIFFIGSPALDEPEAARRAS